MYLRFTPVFLLEQLHRVNAINFLVNLAPSRQDLTGSCVGNELAVHAACLGMSLGALQGCRKPAGHVLPWYKGLSGSNRYVWHLNFRMFYLCPENSVCLELS